MSTTVAVLGKSGSGKSTALRNLDPTQTYLIQAIAKPLPFRAKGWKTGKGGNIWVQDDAKKIVEVLPKIPHPVIVIDDFQYIMANQFMRRVYETGFQKFNDIARDAWDIFTTANAIPGDKRIYILSHTDTDEQGLSKMKTLGKLLDDKVTLEGMVTVCLYTHAKDGKYTFSTQTNGMDTCKSPMGMFDTDSIENDLSVVDKAITDFYCTETIEETV